MVGPFVGGGALAGGSADAFGDREEFLDGLHPTAGGDCLGGGYDGDGESDTRPQTSRPPAWPRDSRLGDVRQLLNYVARIYI